MLFQRKSSKGNLKIPQNFIKNKVINLPLIITIKISSKNSIASILLFNKHTLMLITMKTMIMLLIMIMMKMQMQIHNYNLWLSLQINLIQNDNRWQMRQRKGNQQLAYSKQMQIQLKAHNRRLLLCCPPLAMAQLA